MNAIDVENETDELSTPRGAHRWLVAQGLLRRNEQVSERERIDLIESARRYAHSRSRLMASRSRTATSTDSTALLRTPRSAPSSAAVTNPEVATFRQALRRDQALLDLDIAAAKRRLDFVDRSVCDQTEISHRRGQHDIGHHDLQLPVRDLRYC
jgi:hypothetical protein